MPDTIQELLTYLKNLKVFTLISHHLYDRKYILNFEN